MVKIMRKVILLMLLSVVSSNAMAEWVKVRISDDGNATAYVDPSTMLKDGSNVKMWALLDFRVAKTTGGETYLSTKQQNEFDCKKTKIRLLTFSLYSGNMGNGNVVYESPNIGNWDMFFQGGLGEAFWKIACGKK
ncbi:MAG: surface-adhesin E family protein [Gallionella sp.]